MNEPIRRILTRRTLLTGAAALAAAGCSTTTESRTRDEVDTRDGRDGYPGDEPVTDGYRQEEITGAVENFFGVTAQGAAEVVERVFGDLGQPNAYIAGEEASAAVALGLRYGEGWLYRRKREPVNVFWTGPTLGVDLGLNASKCFTLVYNLGAMEELFRRFPSVEGSYYFIAGIGVNYLRLDDVTLAPMRTGLGARIGLNVGYLNITPDREWVPL